MLPGFIGNYPLQSALGLLNALRIEHASIERGILKLSSLCCYSLM